MPLLTKLAGPVHRKRWSPILARIWMVIVSAAVFFAGLLFVIPNELVGHVGTYRMVSYAAGFVLFVAIAGLPLLVVAAILDRRGRRGSSS